jgi:membrane protease YdiL (CAAX protease family)
MVSAVLFGLGHSHQGWKHVPMVVLVGGVFGALYLLTGSIWLPIILHAVLDAVQGRAAYGILSGKTIQRAVRADESPSP